MTPASLWPPPDMGLLTIGASVWPWGLSRREDTSGRINILSPVLSFCQVLSLFYLGPLLSLNWPYCCQIKDWVIEMTFLAKRIEAWGLTRFRMINFSICCTIHLYYDTMPIVQFGALMYLLLAKRVSVLQKWKSPCLIVVLSYVWCETIYLGNIAYSFVNLKFWPSLYVFLGVFRVSNI